MLKAWRLGRLLGFPITLNPSFLLLLAVVFIAFGGTTGVLVVSLAFAFVLLHDHASEEADGGVRQWGFVRGGMGVLTATMADAAREVGCEIRCDAEVDQILTRVGRAVGVRLGDGEELRAARVLSNADPKRTFLSLCDRAELPTEFVARI